MSETLGPELLVPDMLRGHASQKQHAILMVLMGPVRCHRARRAPLLSVRVSPHLAIGAPWCLLRRIVRFTVLWEAKARHCGIDIVSKDMTQKKRTSTFGLPASNGFHEDCGTGRVLQGSNPAFLAVDRTYFVLGSLSTQSGGIARDFWPAMPNTDESR
jgi:hypothetical protein